MQLKFIFVKEQKMKNKIKQELQNLVDDEYAKFNKKLCPDTKKEMLGIRVPLLRKLAQNIVKEYDWKAFLNQADDNCFEEVLLQGLVIGYAKMEIDEKLDYIQWFVPKIDSWAISDTFCPTLKIKPRDLPKVWDFILPYFESSKEFDVRFAVIMMLDYYLTDEYVDNVLEKLDQVSHEGYYVKMAVAWCLAEIGIKFNEKAMNYLKSDNHLDTFTFNKALQKMRESYRIDSKQKEILKQMKRTNTK